MARDFVINGEALVRVKFGAHILGSNRSGNHTTNFSDLGLAEAGITISPRWQHKDVLVNDFGPNIPTEVMWQLAELRIKMTLIHFDSQVLNCCISESMGGAVSGELGIDQLNNYPAPGLTLPGVGQFLGRGAAPLASGCHFISLNITSAIANGPSRFPTTYLPSQPLEIPLSTEASRVHLEFRAIPYRFIPRLSTPISGGAIIITSTSDIQSSGVLLWDSGTDS